MTALPVTRAGWGLRALPRRTFIALWLATAVLLAGCGQTSPHGSGPASPAAPSSRSDGTSASGGSGSRDAPGGASGETDGGVAGAALPTRVGGLDLSVTAYDMPNDFQGGGSGELRTMLAELGIGTGEVSLVVAVDRSGALAIGRWAMPGRSADAILSAWLGATSGWTQAELGRLPIATGKGPDGSRGWAAARDGVFIYVVTEDRSLAEAALLATS